MSVQDVMGVPPSRKELVVSRLVNGRAVATEGSHGGVGGDRKASIRIREGYGRFAGDAVGRGRLAGSRGGRYEDGEAKGGRHEPENCHFQAK